MKKKEQKDKKEQNDKKEPRYLHDEEPEGYKWAVIGYSKDCFTEDFISKHPMDFYEKEDQIKKEYDFYLRNYHEHYTPSVEFREGQHTVFKCPLTFFGSNPWGKKNLSLKHLRMLMGTEDYPALPLDFAEVEACLGNKDITIDSSSFSVDEPVSTIVKWVREISKCHSIVDHNAVLVFEGNDYAKAMELAIEISEWFGVETTMALYYTESETDQICVSFFWYEAIHEIQSLSYRWWEYCKNKAQYASGDKSINMDDYCELVKKTWWYISHTDWKIDYSLKEGSSFVEINRTFLLVFHEYIKTIEHITYYSVLTEKDNSKDYMFTVTAMLADELSRLAGGKKIGIPQYSFSGEFRGLGGLSMDVTLAAPSPVSKERVIYDIDEMNYQVLLEAAKRINEEGLQE